MGVEGEGWGQWKNLEQGQWKNQEQGQWKNHEQGLPLLQSQLTLAQQLPLTRQDHPCHYAQCQQRAGQQRWETQTQARVVWGRKLQGLP